MHRTHLFLRCFPLTDNSFEVLTLEVLQVLRINLPAAVQSISHGGDMRRVIAFLLCSILIAPTIGCRTPPIRLSKSVSPPALLANPADLADSEPMELSASRQSATTVSFEENTPTATVSEIAVATTFTSESELSLESLVAEVQAVHPSVEAMYSAWQAAAQRYPQVISLDDPMFGATVAPSSFGSRNVESAYALEASQKIPWHGKRALRGAAAYAASNSAERDVETTRQRLAEVAALAFWDYYAARQQLELNELNAVILESFRDNAEIRYQNGLVTQQDILQADVELANLEQRHIELQRIEKVAAGRINVLIRHSPTDPVPPPVGSIDRNATLPDAQFLLALAVQQRPEVSAAAARIQEEQARLALACKQYYPDLEVFGRYDTFWQPRETQSDLRGQVGARINLPVYEKRLNAAVWEARHQVSKARAGHDQIVLEVQAEVQSAYEQVLESQRTVALFSTKLVPTAQQNVDVARSNYDTGVTTFLALATAQRQLIDARERLLQAEVELQRRTATLLRAAGGSFPESADSTNESAI